MLYAIYDPDGRINQANKVYVDDLSSYETLLGDLGHRYVKANAPGLLPPELYYVTSNEITARPVMGAQAAAATIRAGTDAVITGIPKGASVDVFVTGFYQRPIWSMAALDGDELQFPMPSPSKYRAVIRYWPYQDCAIEIEAVA
jgi:hypothetical protein